MKKSSVIIKMSDRYLRCSSVKIVVRDKITALLKQYLLRCYFARKPMIVVNKYSRIFNSGKIVIIVNRIIIGSIFYINR